MPGGLLGWAPVLQGEETGLKGTRGMRKEARHKRSHTVMIRDDSDTRDLRSTQHGRVPETCSVKEQKTHKRPWGGIEWEEALNKLGNGNVLCCN